MLQVHFGPLKTVYSWFCELVHRLLFKTIHGAALMIDQEHCGAKHVYRQRQSTVSDQRPLGKRRGYDADKMIVRCKRHTAFDTDVGLLMLNVPIANSAGAQAVLNAIQMRWPWVTHLSVNGT
jgi:hypothetical protein